VRVSPITEAAAAAAAKKSSPIRNQIKSNLPARGLTFFRCAADTDLTRALMRSTFFRGRSTVFQRPSLYARFRKWFARRTNEGREEIEVDCRACTDKPFVCPTGRPTEHQIDINGRPREIINRTRARAYDHQVLVYGPRRPFKHRKLGRDCCAG
jgi:hypothetical protein